MQSYIYGLHSVTSALAKQPHRIKKILLLAGREDKPLQAIIQMAQTHQIAYERVSRKVLDHLTQVALHQGVLAYVQSQPVYRENDLAGLLQQARQPFILLLDGVQDPHNLGACLRSADAAGVDVVIAPRDRSVGLTPTVVKVSSGAALSVPFIQVTNLVRTMKVLKQQGIWLYGAQCDAQQSLFAMDLAGPVGIVLGAEAQGLRQLTKQTCDAVFHLPMAGTVASLNVSVAAGICLYEVVRRRLQ